MKPQVHTPRGTFLWRGLLRYQRKGARRASMHVPEKPSVCVDGRVADRLARAAARLGTTQKQLLARILADLPRTSRFESQRARERRAAR